VNYLKIGLFGFITFITFNSYGFSCDSPQSTLEISICQDDDLKRLNVVYNEYQFRVQKINMQSADDIGRELYVNLRKCNDDKNCLVDTYKESIQSLLSVTSKNESQQKSVGIEKPAIGLNQVTTEKSNTSWLDMFKNYTVNDYSLLLNAYLLLVGLLYLLTRMYSTKNFITKTLFFIIGFPFVLIGWAVTLVNIRSDRHRYLDENQSGGGSDDDGAEESSSSKKSFGYGANKSSSSGKSVSQNSNDSRETVEIQYQQTGGNWRTLQVVNNNLDQTIAHGMDSVENIISKQSGNTGRVRAKGKKTGTIYDIR
jgi:uncharacterized protein